MYRKISTIAANIATAGVLAAVLIPTIAAAAYYPKAQPSRWYVLPGQTLNFTGSGFAPGGSISITGAAPVSGSANLSGSFTTLPIVVPYSWENTRQTFVVRAAGSAYAIPLTVSVGSFYPNLYPSTYFIRMGQNMRVMVTGFAPGETVTLSGGATSLQAAADSLGDASFDLTAPSSGDSFTITAHGGLSGVSASRTVTLY